MAALDFPANPNVGDLYDGVGVIYEWTGTHWKSNGTHGASCTIGAIVAWGSENVPKGWLECDGKAIPAVYQRLIALIGNNTPDLRGEFVRGWDHGRGVDSGRSIRTSQDESFKSHKHPSTSGGLMRDGGPIIVGPAANPGDGVHTINSGGSASVGFAGGAETRPRNVCLMYIINADGTTSIGPDDRYVLKTGDTMTGDLELIGAKAKSASTVDSDPGSTLVTKDYLLDGATGLSPTGSVTMFAGATIPSGWLECNGQSAPTALAAVLGQANVPDLRGQFVRGWDPSGTVDPQSGRALLSNQDDEFKSHTHTYAASHGAGNSTNGGQFDGDKIEPTGATGGAETRPVNVAMYYIIKT